MLPTQWESPLKPEQSKKESSQQWVADIIHQRNLGHNVAFYICIVSLAKDEKAAQQRRSPKRGRHFEPVHRSLAFGVRRSSGAFRMCPKAGHKIVKRQQNLRADASEFESRLGLYDLTVHLKQRIDQEIDRPAFRFRVDHKIATFRKLKPIRGIMTKIIICELRILPCFADIHRNPLIVREEFGPAMVALDLALLFVRWNGRADSE